MLSAADIQEIRDEDPGAVLPGIDTMTGNPYATSSLLDVTKITQNTKAPYYYSPSTNSVFVTQSGIVLSGINFGDATVYLDANNVTVKDCNFSSTLRQNGQGAIVENNTFVGVQNPTGFWGGFISSNPNITIKYNTLLNAPSDAIDIGGNTITGSLTGGGLIAGNYFEGAGYEHGAHADAIWVTDSTLPVLITDNLIDGTWNNNAPANANSEIRLTAEAGSLSNVTVTGNYLLGGGFVIEAGLGNGAPPNSTITNISVTNNDLGFDRFGQVYPGSTNYATVTGNKTVDFTNPTDSANALAAYVAAGVPTANVVSASSGGISASGSAPTMMLGNGLAGIYLSPGAGETNFVGGYGTQYLYGGKGANILTYLATGDGGDGVNGFDPAKDVIDLSRIDGDLITPGIQNFTFIGDAAFNGAGPEVRYQLDPTNNDTLVQAALAGDTTADFTITIQALTPLTTANFALTPAQSSAALANGAALSYTRVTTAAGAPVEYAYSNVQGRAYTSYESFYGSGTPLVETDDLNLSSNANKLVLYEPSQTVTRGGGTETLTVGSGSDPLTYHRIETIDATTSTGEQFVFSSGFGNETINRFSASGATPDSIQLAKSAFSYLTAGMTQAEDLAAVLSQAARGASGLTIIDTHGDSLTLAGVTPSMVAANPTMVVFK
jgi:hypothetical protein